MGSDPTKAKGKATTLEERTAGADPLKAAASPPRFGRRLCYMTPSLRLRAVGESARDRCGLCCCRRTAALLKPLTTFAALAVAASALAGAILSATANGPQITHFTLSNGLEVVVIPDHRAPVVTHMLWYKVGSADETPGKSGLAHFLEHLMFKGTAKNPSGRFSQVVATIGGQENAFTSADYTGYFQRVPRDKLKAMMEFEADRMTGLVLTDDVVRPELNVVLEEQNMRVANNPAARLGEQMDAALYLNHPYGRPVIGWRHEIEQLDREAALDFYRRFYTPNNAILVVAGDVTADGGPHARRRDLRQGPPRRRDQAAPAPAGAGAAGGAHRDAGRSARHPAQREPLLSRSLEHDGAPGRERSARRARAYPGPRLEQPALSDAGGRQGHRGECRREL